MASTPLHTRMLVGFIAGAGLGLLANAFFADAAWLAALVDYVADPVGQLFLRLLFMLVIPLVFSALVLGVVEIGDPRSLGRIGGRTLAWILVVTSIAVTIGLVLVNLLQPGKGLPPELGQALLAEQGERAAQIAAGGQSVSAMSVLLNIVPRNPIQAAANGDLIAVMFFALMVGIAATVLRGEATETLLRGIQGLFKVSMTLIGLVIRLAPYAVFCFMFNLAALFGWDLLRSLGAYVGVVVLALLLHMLVVYSLMLKFLGGWSPLKFFRGSQEAMVMAFSTASSNATLPVALQVAEEKLHLPRKVSRFVLTVGATANQNGTALFEGVVVIFLAQVYGIDLTFYQQVQVMFVCILGGIGTAGVPGGSLPLIAGLLITFGIPPEGLGLVLGVDRFLDMCRTTLNVTGDLMLAAVVSNGEEEPQAA